MSHQRMASLLHSRPLHSLPSSLSCTCLTKSLRRSYATIPKNTTSAKNTSTPAAQKHPSSKVGVVASVVSREKPATYISPRKINQASGPLIMRSYKPRTPGLRHLRRPINDHLWKGRPYRPLTWPKKGCGRGGRNNTGRVTVRHRGGGHKRRIRTVDFHRTAPGKHIVERIEHDPNRSAHIALVINDATKEKSYIIAADGMRAGDEVESYRAGLPPKLIASMGGTIDPGMLAAKIVIRGNCMPIKLIPLGTQVYNVGSAKERGAVFCRSAGTFATVVSKEETRKKVKEIVVRLQSGEMRRVSPDACATIGVASNPHFHFRQLGKAGRSRWLGIRPTVRGVAMNAVDHPHGGGRGKTKGR